MIGIVLAAGYGKLDATDESKLLAPVGGMPMVMRVIDSMRLGGCHRLVVVTNHLTCEPLKWNIQKYLETRRLGPDCIMLVQQPWRCGTAGAVAYGLAAIPEATTYVCVVNGDMPLITHKTIQRLYENMCALPGHVMHVTLTTSTTETESCVERYGRVIIDPRVGPHCIVEFCDATITERAIEHRNVGLYGFRTDFLHRTLPLLLPHTRRNGPPEYYLPEVLRHMHVAERANAINVGHPLEALGVNTDDDYVRVCAAHEQLNRLP